jgi:hypothetical protein
LWCRDHPGQCTLDGAAAAACDERGCKLPIAKTLRVPIALFASQLGARRQLAVKLVSGTNQPDESNFHVTLDAAVGKPLSALEIFGIPKTICFDLAPFPTTPMTLVSARNDSGTNDNWYWLSFVDYACHQANPPPADCGAL